MMKPMRAPIKTQSNNVIVTEDCDDPRYSKVHIPCDTIHVAEQVAEFLSRHEILGTIYGDLVIWRRKDKWEVVE